MTAAKVIKIAPPPAAWRIASSIDTYACDSEIALKFAQNLFGGKTSRPSITYRH